MSDTPSAAELASALYVLLAALPPAHHMPAADDSPHPNTAATARP